MNSGQNFEMPNTRLTQADIIEASSSLNTQIPNENSPGVREVLDLHGRIQAYLTSLPSSVWIIDPVDNEINSFTVNFNDPSVRDFIASPRPWNHPNWSTSFQINILLELLYWEAKLSVEDDFRFELFRCTRRVARKFEMLPGSVYLRDLTREGNDPIWGGGYADIWKGRAASGEDTCLKVLRIFTTDTSTNQVFKDFSQEVLVWSQLNHPNVLPFLGINVHLFPGRFCLVSPWYSHGSVVNYLSRHPEVDKTEIMNDILKGLKYLHTRNPPVVHGDLKGSNVLVSDSGNCCLADFGLAGMMSTFQTLSSITGNQRGSVRWMAPELFDFTALARLSTYTDMYALGCTILEIITGAPPFSEVKLPDIAISIQVMNGTRPSRPAVGFSDELWRAVTTCWAHPPNDRPTIQAFMRMMECETGRNPTGEDVDRRYSPATLGGFGGEFPPNDEPLLISGQPVASSFSDARSRSRPRAHSQSRHNERPLGGSQSGRWVSSQEERLELGQWEWVDNNDSYFNRPNHYDEEEEETEEMRSATRHLMNRMDRVYQDVHQAEDTNWDLLDSFGDMGISEPQHRSRSRQRGSLERDRLATGLANETMPHLDGHAYTDQDRISRPRDWRPEYTLKGEITDPVRFNLHSLLHQISSSHPPMRIDLRYPIQSQLQNIIFPLLRRPPTSIDLAQMATEPPTPHMRFFHPRLPWYIDVVSVDVGMDVMGLTVDEVLEGVWKELQRPIKSQDFYNEEMGAVMSAMPSSPYTPHSPFPGEFTNPPSPGLAGPQMTARDLMTVAFRARCKAVGQLYGDHPMAEMGQVEAGEISKGVRRIDWLGMEGEWAWTGIVRKGVMWELQTRRVVS